jgi:putative Ca2+/H+ antiporter (TMEM165/GDT1 family)
VRFRLIPAKIEMRHSNMQGQRVRSAGAHVKGSYMVLNHFLTAFSVIFLAELGDKTQLAVITMSASTRKPLAIFLGGSLAMVLLTGIGAVAGEMVTKFVPEEVLSKAAAILFVLMGIWTWFRG